ncbi:pyridoxamine 5'-phosphate oxidase [Pontibacter sp. G13]|uniref:pyridoxamine 5'-phosphate oxidase n=1 Tax=Pontibacter sp. G13 TaxID=3074898 RepID=UPI00288B5393|nr:pyridoxamine 5'-phosphate oxidase [Pontibacter sp. G13]WNJ16782.1 pyridoxamine 5'-phosphate oxidase [Pontibacter sp. G13]
MYHSSHSIMSIRKKVSDIRTDYTQSQLDESHISADPIVQFEQWFQQAVDSEVMEPNAMTLATSVNGKPTIRIVLLKGFDDQGFHFFTNYESRKGQELAANPAAALNFFWPELQRQVRIEGMVEKLEADQSDSYYQSRGRGSQIGAWASPQSQEIAGREVLEEMVEEVTKKYEGETPIPRPEHWGGYRLKPTYLEFWQGRSSRLHDRIVYELNDQGEWRTARLAP